MTNFIDAQIEKASKVPKVIKHFCGGEKSPIMYYEVRPKEIEQIVKQTMNATCDYIDNKSGQKVNYLGAGKSEYMKCNHKEITNDLKKQCKE